MSSVEISASKSEDLIPEDNQMDAEEEIDTSESKDASKDKKLTHKEKKKLKKQQEYEKQVEVLTKKGGQGHSELDRMELYNVSSAENWWTKGCSGTCRRYQNRKFYNFSKGQ